MLSSYICNIVACIILMSINSVFVKKYKTAAMAITFLESHNLIVTPVRLHILEKFLYPQATVSAAEIREKMGLNCNKTTIYRTIDIFLEKGIIHRIADYEGTIRYGLTPFRQPESQRRQSHVHFKCLSCKATICLFQLLIEPPILPEGYVAQKTDMLVVGLCADCSLA